MANGGNITRSGSFHLNGNGNGHRPVYNATLESGGFLVAEGTSMAASLGVVALADIIVPKHIMQYGSQVLGKAVVEPLLDTIDNFTSMFCKLEECKPDKSESREKRAEKIGKGMIVFTSAYFVAMGAKLLSRRLWNDAFKIAEERPPKIKLSEVGFGKWLKHGATLQFMSPKEKMLFGADEGVHYASLYLLNNQFAPFTDHMIRKTAEVIHNTTGADEKKSHDIASMWSIWELPNLLGAATGIGTIYGYHTADWPKPDSWAGKVLANKPREDKFYEQTMAERELKKKAEEATKHTHAH